MIDVDNWKEWVAALFVVIVLVRFGWRVCTLSWSATRWTAGTVGSAASWCVTKKKVPLSPAAEAALAALDDESAVLEKNRLSCTGLAIFFNVNDEVHTTLLPNNLNVLDFVKPREAKLIEAKAEKRLAEVRERDRLAANHEAAEMMCRQMEAATYRMASVTLPTPNVLGSNVNPKKA